MSHNKINKPNNTENNSESTSNTNELKAAKRRDGMIDVLKKSGWKGMTVPQLTKEMEYKSRTSVPRIIEEINKIYKEKQENEMIIKLNKKETYVLASELAKRELATQYMVFGQDAIRELSGGISHGLNSFIVNGPDSTNQIYDLMQNEESFFSEFYEKMKLSEESKFLLDFTLKMGSIISFIMLKAIEPSGDDEEKDGKTKEFESSALVNHAINPSQILYHFMQQDIVKNGKLKKKSNVRNLLRNKNSDTRDSHKAKILLDNSISDDLYSHYEVNSMTFQKLKNSYKDVWPGTFRILTDLFQEKRLQKITTRGISEAMELKKHIEDAKKSQGKTG